MFYNYSFRGAYRKDYRNPFRRISALFRRGPVYPPPPSPDHSYGSSLSPPSARPFPNSPRRADPFRCVCDVKLAPRDRPPGLSSVKSRVRKFGGGKGATCQEINSIIYFGLSLDREENPKELTPRLLHKQKQRK